MSRTLPFALLLAGLVCAMPPTARAAELLVGNKSADTVWRLSLRDGRRVGEFRTGEAPHEIAVAPDGRSAVVTNYGEAKSGSTLSVLDLVGGTPTRAIRSSTRMSRCQSSSWWSSFGRRPEATMSCTLPVTSVGTSCAIPIETR